MARSLGRTPHHPITKSPDRQISSYWDRSQWPLQALYFLMPLLVLYEIGTVTYAPTGNERLPPIWAESLLAYFFHLFGVTGYYLPGVIVVVVLVCWHLVRRDLWRPEPALYGLMAMESLVLAMPLFIFGLVLFREHAAQFSTAALALAQGDGIDQIPSWQAGVVFSIGAGIYEELLFRLIAIALLHFVLADVLALSEAQSAVGAMGLSAVAFAVYHFLGPTDFHFGKFLFHTLAGIYFAAIYVLRGFGIVAATHAIYDVLVVTALFYSGGKLG